LLGNNVSPPLLRTGGALLQCRRRGLGDAVWSPVLAQRLHQVMLLLAHFCLDAALFVGVVVVGWPDLPPSSLGGGGCRWRAQIWELDKLGRGPGRWAIAVGFIPSSRWVSTSTPSQSLCAMGLLQLTAVIFFLFGGDGRRRGGRPQRNHEGSRGIIVISVFLGSSV
jgi:hypothetical protein